MFLKAGRACAQDQPPQPSYDSQAEDTLFRLLNQARQENGLPALALDERLANAARAHSALMARNLQLRHQADGEPTLTERLASTNLRFDRVAENVAFSETAENAHDGLMHSPGHRANILSAQSNAVGVGVVRRGSTLWVTQDFAHRLPVLTDEQAEDLAADSFRQLRKSPLAVRVNLPRLRSLACAMSKTGELDTTKALGLPDIRYTVAFTTAEPAELPEGARKLRAQQDISRFAVGACFAASPEYPSGMYWMLMAFY